jgi:hypothetical protein
MLEDVTGCTHCRAGAQNASWPPPQRVAVTGDGPTYLHLCRLCGTFWQFDLRLAKPISVEKARQLYPAHFADWSLPRGEASLPLMRSGADFSPLDALSSRDAPLEGELEQALEDKVKLGSQQPLLPLLSATLLQVPSTTLPGADGSGMTPLALNRPPVVWILAFTRLDLARRFAEDGPYCLEFAGTDLIARLPKNFGLHLNYGAASSRQIKPQKLLQSIPHRVT